MRQLLLENYKFKGNRTDPRHHVDRLAESFGHLNAEEITEERIREYARRRMEKEGKAPATLRRELAVLKRMLRLASSRLPRVPLVDMPRVDNARQGFFEQEDVQALLPNLPGERPEPRRVSLPHGLARERGRWTRMGRPRVE